MLSMSGDDLHDRDSSIPRYCMRLKDVVYQIPCTRCCGDLRHSMHNHINGMLLDVAAFVPIQDAPWSVRLACKLLRLKSHGDDSPWSPYLDVLPDKVPAPLETFTWEDMSHVEYQPAQVHIIFERYALFNIKSQIASD